MRQGASGRRTRGRSGGRKHVPLKMQNFDSNGPDVRVRGNANQVYEKYLALARDANAAGDRVMAESYHQHAEHYYRIINETTDPQGEHANRGEQPDGAGDEWGRPEPQPRQGGRPSRQERRERYEQGERPGGAGPGTGEAPDKGPDHRRPDGYGRIADGEADGAEGERARAGANSGGDTAPQGDLLNDGESAAVADTPSRTRTRKAGDGAEPPAEEPAKAKRSRGRSRKNAGRRGSDGEEPGGRAAQAGKDDAAGGGETDAAPANPGNGSAADGGAGDNGTGDNGAGDNGEGGDGDDHNGALAG